MAPVLDVFNVSIAGASEMIINSVFVLFRLSFLYK